MVSVVVIHKKVSIDKERNTVLPLVKYPKPIHTSGLMRQGGNKTTLSRSQFEIISTNYDKGLLNKGSNYNGGGLPNSGSLRKSNIFQMTNTYERNKKVDKFKPLSR